MIERIGDAVLYCGDYLDVLPTLGSVDAVVTDPPYGLGGATTLKNNYKDYEDSPAAALELVDGVMAWGAYTRMVMTPGQKMMFSYKQPDAIGAFYYPAGTGSCAWGFVGWQPIFYYGRDPVLEDCMGRSASCYASTEAAEKNGHPCVKPIKQWTWLTTRASRRGEVVLDPFMGSGTTGVSCAMTGRRFIGIELVQEYFDIACKRVEEAYKQPDMFINERPPKYKHPMLDFG